MAASRRARTIRTAISPRFATRTLRMYLVILSPADPAIMLLRQVVDTSRAISETSKRTAKVTLAADLLRQLAPEEIHPVAAYISGATRQGKIGIGYATLRDTMGSPAPQPSLTVMDLDTALHRLSATRGTREKQTVLREIMARATEPEQRFLIALLVGELRQGALEGLMVDALAKAVGAPTERVRRAVMMAGDFAGSPRRR